MQVSEHILDTVPLMANKYIEENRERLFPEASDEAWLDFLENVSSHRFIQTPERREIHRRVLNEIGRRGITGEKPEKPLLIYICGPMGSGKTTLLDAFDERIRLEREEAVYDLYNSAPLETVFKKYQAASAYCIKADFQLFKDSLPEYAESGGDYSVIRAEAAGLNEACQAWAKELDACVIIEQLGYGGINQTVLEKMQAGHELHTIAVTASPEVNAYRLIQRTRAEGSEANLGELAKAIRGVSQPDEVLGVLATGESGVLLSSDQGYEVVAAWGAGRRSVFNASGLEKFEQQGVQSEEQILAVFRSCGLENLSGQTL